MMKDTNVIKFSQGTCHKHYNRLSSVKINIQCLQVTTLEFNQPLDRPASPNLNGIPSPLWSLIHMD